MKIKRLICLFLSIVMVGMAAIVPAYAQEEIEDSSVTNGCNSIDAMSPLCGSEKMLKTAKSAILYEVNTKTMMYSWNPDQVLYPASLVKIMTAMVVIENSDVTQKIEIKQSVLDLLTKNINTLKLLPGEIIAIEDLLYGLMVGSHNDAAIVLADVVAGSQDKFVEMMNTRAQELGCKDTVFVNPHGLHDERQVSTARDITRILECAMQSELFMKYFGATTYSIQSTNLSKYRYMESSNYLSTPSKDEYYMSKVTGGRTGITNLGERSIAATAEGNGLKYIVIIMGAVPEYVNDSTLVKRFGSYEEAKELLEMGFDGYVSLQILSTQEVLGSQAIDNADNHVSLVPQLPAVSVLPDSVVADILTVSYDFNQDSLLAPIKEGDNLGTVRVWYGGVCIAQSPVLAGNSVIKSGNSYSTIEERSEDRTVLYIILAVIGALVLLGAVVILVLKFLEKRGIHLRAILANRFGIRR